MDPRRSRCDLELFLGSRKRSSTASSLARCVQERERSATCTCTLLSGAESRILLRFQSSPSGDPTHTRIDRASSGGFFKPFIISCMLHLRYRRRRDHRIAPGRSAQGFRAGQGRGFDRGCISLLGTVSLGTGRRSLLSATWHCRPRTFTARPRPDPAVPDTDR